MDGKRSPAKPLLIPVVGNIYLAQNLRTVPLKAYRIFRTDEELTYHALCDDFGPMNISSVFNFIEMIEKQLSNFPTAKIVYLADRGRRALTNAVFLLGAYMILKLKRTSQQAVECFSALDATLVVPFRDATFSEPDFDLTLMDCWRGLERGIANGWVSAPKDTPGVWGLIDQDEYDQYDDPLNADLHEVLPGKFVAFKGPRELGGGADYLDDAQGYRHFSPGHYARIFKALGVTDVVRLNEPQYDGQCFAEHGLRHHDLEFEDCTAPTPEVIQAFLKVVDGAAGAVAVHCKAGLGRTGTLIALCMMRTHNFTAREAIGWLRIMRPGSVIGEQQRFLCHVEACVARSLSAAAKPPPAKPQLAPVAPPPALAAPPPLAKKAATAIGGLGRAVAVPPAALGDGRNAAVLAAQVAAGLERRGALRSRFSAAAAASAGSVLSAAPPAPDAGGKVLPPILSSPPPALLRR